MWEIPSFKDTSYKKLSIENLVKAGNNSQLLKKSVSYSNRKFYTYWAQLFLYIRYTYLFKTPTRYFSKAADEHLPLQTAHNPTMARTTNPNYAFSTEDQSSRRPHLSVSPSLNLTKYGQQTQECTQIRRAAWRRVTVPAEPGAGSSCMPVGAAKSVTKGQGWQRWKTKSGRMSDLFRWRSHTHHVSDGQSKAPGLPISQNIVFLSARHMNSTCLVRQGEKEKPEMSCFTFHINRQNSHVSSEKATFIIPKPNRWNLPVCKAVLWQATRRACLPACTPTASVGSIRVTSMSLSTIFNVFKRYLYISLPLPIVTLAHSSPTMYQENILCEKAGLDAIHYFCSYKKKKKTKKTTPKKKPPQLGCVPLIQVCTMYGHSYLKQRTDNFGNVQTQSNWNNPSLTSNTYSHKPNLCKVTPSTRTRKPLDLSQAQYEGKRKAHHPRVTGTGFGS